MFGVITVFITHFLSYGLRSRQSCIVGTVWTGRPGNYGAVDRDGGRRPGVFAY
jgi:hypothetical protein